MPFKDKNKAKLYWKKRDKKRVKQLRKARKSYKERNELAYLLYQQLIWYVDREDNLIRKYKQRFGRYYLVFMKNLELQKEIKWQKKQLAANIYHPMN